MTKIKLCGLTRPLDIRAVNELMPDYVGFVFYPKSKRFITPKHTMRLREMLDPGIRAVGVFVDEPPEKIAVMMEGMGSGETFDWSAVAGVKREFFLAGGLNANNVAAAIQALHPFGVDVSSGIETEGVKDLTKMAAFVAAVRKEDAK